MILHDSKLIRNFSNRISNQGTIRGFDSNFEASQGPKQDSMIKFRQVPNFLLYDLAIAIMGHSCDRSHSQVEMNNSWEFSYPGIFFGYSEEFGNFQKFLEIFNIE